LAADEPERLTAIMSRPEPPPFRDTASGNLQADL